MPSSGFQTCARSEEHTSELQSHSHLVCRLLLEKKKIRSEEHTTELQSHSHIVCLLLLENQTNPPTPTTYRRPPRSTLFPYTPLFRSEHTSERQSPSHLVCRLLEFRRVL